jgi:hypothetical protein
MGLGGTSFGKMFTSVAERSTGQVFARGREAEISIAKSIASGTKRSASAASDTAQRTAKKVSSSESPAFRAVAGRQGLTGKYPGKDSSFITDLDYASGPTVTHGSREKGLKEITPKLGSTYMPEDEVVWGWNPKALSTEELGKRSSDYTKGFGSVYIGKMRASQTIQPLPERFASYSPIRVTDEIDALGYNESTRIPRKVYRRELNC